MSRRPPCGLAVLIASHNRRERLRTCLGALCVQTADPADFEVIVADDGSSDGTAEMVDAFESPFRLRVLRLDKRGKPAALNAAIEVCDAGSCLFIDDDVIASPELIAAHAAAAREDPGVLGIGKLTQRSPRRSDWLMHAHAEAWNRRYDDLARRPVDWTDCYGANFSAPLAVLREIGGFDAGLDAVEDIELGFRLCQAGCTPAYLPSAHATHDDEKPRRRIVADIVGYGEFCAAFGERVQSTRPRLLGWFRDTTPRELWLRRALIGLRLRPGLLAAAGRAIPGRGRRRVWFDFVSHYAFWLGVRRSFSRRRWRETTGGVPVLLYHAFSHDDEGDDYVLPERSFAWQMRLLALLRFRLISAGELAKCLREYRLPSRRTAVITIDDGYADNFEIAFPILRRHRFAATIYLVSERLGKSNDWNSDGAAMHRPMLSRDAIRSMLAERMEFGSHTLTHCSLPDAPADVASREIADSRASLERTLTGPVETFAYPYGRLDGQTAEIVERASYNGAYASHNPVAASLGDDPLQIPRIEIRGGDRVPRFLRKLLLGGA